VLEKIMDIFKFFENVVYPRVIEIFGVVQIDFDKEGDFGYLTRFDLYSNKKRQLLSSGVVIG
jgi:hypothetical protein